ncbi:hypothetical protein [Fluviicoccus keumensis]|uniref:hypothetical protein n=1 Tax=Fluviicoccus keumensis TaxID=1435465 RepID=UPI00102CC94A|nr:hypothetical protein [Fluviicoccus keumensis]
MNTTIHCDIFDIFIPYTPAGLGHRDNHILGKYGEDWKAAKEAGNNYLWTLIQGDGDELYVVSNLHFVNSLGFIVTRKPHNGAFLQFRWTHKEHCLTPAGRARRIKQVLADVARQAA